MASDDVACEGVLVQIERAVAVQVRQPVEARSHVVIRIRGGAIGQSFANGRAPPNLHERGPWKSRSAELAPCRLDLARSRAVRALEHLLVQGDVLRGEGPWGGHCARADHTHTRCRALRVTPPLHSLAVATRGVCSLRCNGPPPRWRVAPPPPPRAETAEPCDSSAAQKLRERGLFLTAGACTYYVTTAPRGSRIGVRVGE